MRSEHAPQDLTADAGSHAARGAFRRRFEHPLAPAAARPGLAENQIVQRAAATCRADPAPGDSAAGAWLHG